MVAVSCMVVAPVCATTNIDRQCRDSIENQPVQGYAGFCRDYFFAAGIANARSAAASVSARPARLISKAFAVLIVHWPVALSECAFCSIQEVNRRLVSWR